MNPTDSRWQYMNSPYLNEYGRQQLRDAILSDSMTPPMSQEEVIEQYKRIERESAGRAKIGHVETSQKDASKTSTKD